MDGTGKLYWIVPSDIPNLDLPDRTFGFIQADENVIVMLVDEDADLESEVDLKKGHIGTLVRYRARKVNDGIYYATRVSKLLEAAVAGSETEAAVAPSSPDEKPGRLQGKNQEGFTGNPRAGFVGNIRVEGESDPVFINADDEIDWIPTTLRTEATQQHPGRLDILFAMNGEKVQLVRRA